MLGSRVRTGDWGIRFGVGVRDWAEVARLEVLVRVRVVRSKRKVPSPEPPMTSR